MIPSSQARGALNWHLHRTVQGKIEMMDSDRIPRSVFWKYFGILIVAIFIVRFVINVGVPFYPSGGIILLVFGYLVLLVLALLFIQLGVNRLHDLNRTGWWMILSFIPIVNLVLLIYLGSKKGRL